MNEGELRDTGQYLDVNDSPSNFYLRNILYNELMLLKNYIYERND